MNKPILTFSSGCVINLDDIQDFPDYCQVMNKLLISITTNKLDVGSLRTLLDAQIQDIQHIHQFKQVLKQLTTKYEQIFKQQTLKLKFIKMLLKLSKNYFTSFTMDQEQVIPILTILRKQLYKYTVELCDFWLAISKFAAYVEKHQDLIDLYLRVVNQQQIFKDEQLSLKYIKSIDKILRFRMFRQTFYNIRNNNNYKQNGKYYQNTPFLDFKLALYENKGNKQFIRQKFNEFVKIAAKINSGNTFVHRYIVDKQKQVK